MLMGVGGSVGGGMLSAGEMLSVSGADSSGGGGGGGSFSAGIKSDESDNDDKVI